MKRLFKAWKTIAALVAMTLALTTLASCAALINGEKGETASEHEASAGSTGNGNSSANNSGNSSSSTNNGNSSSGSSTSGGSSQQAASIKGKTYAGSSGSESYVFSFSATSSVVTYAVNLGGDTFEESASYTISGTTVTISDADTVLFTFAYNSSADTLYWIDEGITLSKRL